MKSFAPGRVELLGNHTDYNGGVVLSASLDLGITMSGAVRPDGKISIGDKGMPRHEFGDKLHREGKWTDYIAGVAALLRDEGHRIGGFDIEVSSSLPLGAGLSSSAATEVATALLLGKLFEIPFAPWTLARFCRRVENEFVGVNCGILDQVSSIFGKAGHAIFLDCRSESVQLVPFPDDCGLLIINSGVKHALVGGEYNERREMCFEAARFLGVKELRDASGDQVHNAKNMPDIIRRRALHVVGENERVFAAVEAMRQCDGIAFGKLMSASHASSIHNFENSAPELDMLVELALRQPHIYGARLTGGGFGGAVVALGKRDALSTASVKITEAYRTKTGLVATPIICQPGNGAMETAVA